MKIVITMAGTGERFRRAGYTVDKHAIIWRGRTLFEWAIDSCRNFFHHEFIFVTRDTPGISEFIYEASSRTGLSPKQIKIKTISQATRGQAATAKLAEEFFDHDEPVSIFNIDTYVNPDFLKPADIRGDGWIPVFPAEGARWSFVDADAQGKAKRVTEKDRISNHCSIGFYYFHSFSEFQRLVETLTSQAAEWYIAPLYNEYIRKGHSVFIHELPAEAVIVLGTPEDLDAANKRPLPQLK